MNRHREIMALLASGISPASIVKPVLISSLSISLLCLIIGEFALPSSASKAYQLKREHIRSRREKVIWNNVLFCSASGRIYYLIGEYNKQTKHMRRIQISEYTKEGRESASIWAKSGEVASDHWLLKDGIMRKYGPSGELLEEERFKTLKLKVDQDPADYLLSQKKPEELSIRELINRIRKFQSSGLVCRQETVTLHRKIATPFANLIFLRSSFPHCCYLLCSLQHILCTGRCSASPCSCRLAV